MALHPDFPVVSGEVQLTEDWSLTLDQPHNRRIEDGSLIIWRPGFTVWIDAWGNDHDETIRERIEWISSEACEDAFAVVSEPRNSCFLHAYRLDEHSDGGVVKAYYAYMVALSGHLQVAIYFDDLSDVELASMIIDSITHTDDGGA